MAGWARRSTQRLVLARSTPALYYYSENVGLETKKGKAERKAKGLHNGLVPFGYRSVGGVAEPEPDTAEGARLAFRPAAAGQSLTRIVQALNAKGYRTGGNMRRSLFTSVIWRRFTCRPSGSTPSSPKRPTRMRPGMTPSRSRRLTGRLDRL